jgi:hypothetical protein
MRSRNKPQNYALLEEVDRHEQIGFANTERTATSEKRRDILALRECHLALIDVGHSASFDLVDQLAQRHTGLEQLVEIALHRLAGHSLNPSAQMILHRYIVLGILFGFQFGIQTVALRLVGGHVSRVRLLCAVLAVS